jgi:hypothetical protein
VSRDNFQEILYGRHDFNCFLRFGRGGGDRKQYRLEFQRVRRHDGEQEDIEREQQGAERNPYWPLNGPSFFDSAKFLKFTFQMKALRVCRLSVKFRGADGKPAISQKVGAADARTCRFLHEISTVGFTRLTLRESFLSIGICSDSPAWAFPVEARSNRWPRNFSSSAVERKRKLDAGIHFFDPAFE